ncbi:MAG: hypothetical protein J6A61_02675 [Clostridia bacterium]|nr:hypothetical protein [Clostridia bacterium]
MKKEWTSGKIALGFLGIMAVLFTWCNLMGPVAGMGGGDYFQIASGGFFLNSGNGCQTWFSAIPFENSYTGTMNWILRPLSLLVSGIDVRILAVLYFIAVATAFSLLLWKMPVEKLWHKFLIGGVATFLFFDFAYLLHLNSMNPEGAFYCLILVMICVLLSQLSGKPGMIRNILYLALAFFVAGIKTGYYWIGILLSLCLLPTLLVRKELWYRIVTVVLTLVVSVGCVACFADGVYFQKDQQNHFHSVYYGVLKDNSDPSAITALGLPQDATSYVGKTVYEVDSSVVDDATYHVGYPDIISYYLSHPAALWAKMERSADNGYEIRQQYVSNYPEYQKIKYGFNGYSAIKRRFLQPDFWFVLAVLGAVIVFCALQLKKEISDSKKAYHLFLILLCITTLAAFMAPVVISGEAALSAELFLYNLLFDIVFCHIIVGGTIILLKRRENIQKKYGVQQ